VTRKLSLLLLATSLLALASAAPALGAGGLIAPASACPGQADLEAPVETQQATMLCMVEYARAQAGAGQLTAVEALEQSARDKGSDVLRCNSFSHFACGREFDYWMRQAGYMSSQCWRVGENLAWGTGSYGSVRSIFRAWMRSPGHRENILDDFTETGVSLRIGTLEEEAGTRIWTEHFGSHCK
jgi:uncharacterized protein YkwD